MKQKVALVLEGGGMRGAFTAGVLDWLIEQQVTFDLVLGISMGALYGGFYVTKQRELLKRCAIEIAPAKDNVGIKAFLKEGQLVAYDKLFYKDLIQAGFDVKKIAQAIEKLEIGIYSMQEYATLFKSNHEIAQTVDWVKAACTLPIFGKQVKIAGINYLDGGLTTMIPIGRAQQEGATRFIVVTTKSSTFVRKPFPKWQIWLLRNILYRKHPKMVNHFSLRTDVYYKERKHVDELVASKQAIHLFPTAETGVSRYKGTKSQFERLFQMGRDVCEANREEILQMFR